MARAVVDASVVAALLVDDPLTAGAAVAWAEIGDETDKHAPDLLLHEVANVLANRHRRGELDEDVALAAIEAVMRLDLDIHPVASLAGPALALAMAHGLTTHDAAYLALSLQLGATLITGDQTLATRARRAGAVVRLVSSP